MTPTENEFGEIGMRWSGREPGPTLLRADPCIIMGRSMLETWRARRWLSLSNEQGYERSGALADGDLITVRALNRTVVYRVISYYPEYDQWVLEWPD